MKVVSWNILANEFIKKADYPMIKAKMLFNRKGRLTQITNGLWPLSGFAGDCRHRW